MTPGEALGALGLFVAGALGGALNSVAGGGSFLLFPALLVAGLPPVVANATTTVALWPAGISSAAAYRRELPRDRRELAVLGAASLVGGLAGAKLLLVTSDAAFVKLLPLLMLVASVVFTFGPRLTRRNAGHMPLAFAAVLQLVIATYGGYFGGGMGILMLATFTLMGMRDMHVMNALKVVLGVLINGVAVVAFVIDGKVAAWGAVPAAVGAVAGGFAGAALARRVDGKKVRVFVLVFAWTLTVWFAVKVLAAG